MVNSPYGIEINRRQGKIILSLKGSFTGMAIVDLKNRFNQALDQLSGQKGILVVDFSEVEMISSGCAELFLCRANDLRSRKIELNGVVPSSNSALGALKLLGFDQLYPLYESVDSISDCGGLSHSDGQHE